MADQLPLFERCHMAALIEHALVDDAVEAADQGDFVVCEGLAFWLGSSGLEVVDVPAELSGGTP